MLCQKNGRLVDTRKFLVATIKFPKNTKKKFGSYRNFSIIKLLKKWGYILFNKLSYIKNNIVNIFKIIYKKGLK